jgi:hypothetical protein
MHFLSIDRAARLLLVPGATDGSCGGRWEDDMKRLWIVGLLVASAAVATPKPASADWRVVIGVGQDRGERGSGPAYRYGYDRGWREGSEEGYSDGKHRRDPRFWRDGEFRDGDRGYKGWMGPRWEYASEFRQGYEAGYRRAFASARPGWHDRDRYDDHGRYGYENNHR